MKTLYISLIAILITFSAFAQPGGKKMRERIKAQKTAFITSKLDLTSNEAEQFWPIFNAYEEKVERLRRNGFKEIRKALKDGTLSDSDAQDALDNFLDSEDELVKAKRQLVSDLKSVISPQKIIKLKMAEDAFNRELLGKLRELREKRGKR